MKIQLGLPRYVLSLPDSGAAVVVSTWALFIMATAVTFRPERKAALMDSGCSLRSHTRALKLLFTGI